MNIEEFYSSKANKRTDVDFDDLEKYLRKIKYERKKINVKFGPVKENIRLKRNMLFGSSKVNYNKKKIANTLSMKDENEINLTIKGNTPGYLEISNSIIAKNTKPFSIYNMKQTIDDSSDLISEKSIGVSINSDNEEISVVSSSSTSSKSTNNLNSIDENPELASQQDPQAESIQVV